MSQRKSYDAVIIGSGPNGLAAGIELARNGYSVVVFEAEKSCGGGARSAALTLPGFVHDVCSAVHPLAAGSPFFSRLPLADHSLQFIFPPAAVAHPFDDGTAVVLERSVEATSEALGRDGSAYRHLLKPLVAGWNDLAANILGPPRWPSHPIMLARFGLRALRSACALAESRFAERNARGFFAGLAAHSSLPLEKTATAAFGLVLGVTGHAVGWPVIRKGSGELTAALVSLFQSFGGEIITDRRISRLEELPEHRVVLCDITPRQLLRLAGDRLPARFQQKLRGYRYGPA
ncbi:MAG TPA: NAD(P)/FAD-dependent oxidoreductase, partial [Pyrinomonadaceae bacterium]|nr:NAD(P)/FAD-dependent oxidoreductase [Pyrinomonadaceae bacterium]